MTAKRLFDLATTVPGLLVLAPGLVLVGLWLKWDSPGPVFFRQTRVGKDGRLFRVYKFRTMVHDVDQTGAKVTTGNDRRITKVGRFLRKYKLDELPQLINVVKGEMSLVGPRPEVPEYVAYYPEASKRKVLSVPPGITDRASLEFQDENALLAGVADPHAYYVSQVLPKKLAYYEDYVDSRTLGEDLRLVLRTIGRLVR